MIVIYATIIILGILLLISIIKFYHMLGDTRANVEQLILKIEDIADLRMRLKNIEDWITEKGR